MNQTETWRDICRIVYKGTGNAETEETEMQSALDVAGQTAQAVLNRKLFQGYEALEPMKRECVWLVKVIESTLAPYPEGFEGCVVFLEVVHTCNIRKLP